MIDRVIRRIKRGNIPDRYAIGRQISRTYYQYENNNEYNTGGIDVFAEDWDNLIILDACRYDSFKPHANDLDGVLESRISRGSMTREWVRANFSDRDLHDVVYVTANGNYAHIRDEINSELHAHKGVWQSEFREGDENTIARPETLTEVALEAANEYPNKRLLIHYVQPHYPFIGPFGRDHFNATDELNEIPKKYGLQNGLVQRAYEENLEIVVEDVKTLLPELEGKTVISADHGELLGERVFPTPIRIYGHPDGVYMDELVKIPWFIVHGDNRKEITSEPPTAVEEYDESGIEQQLQDLGYVI
ncbi:MULTISPECIES: hypothetical protein [unclassified Haladaptatus]|uniref:hypothetical protein n=1 Tax=unclassified Haladaptatus TaxID=2622732 RepID=UPI00209BE6F6|nr:MULTISPECIES: hypothetical protein [unclassified Haladaptatus]MCO8246707.1 hypothetical protein [Haladaptatus sp. AB643]MCO8256355.1 hypothetical protein [Haladaptatus sp. AB618]